MTGYSMTISVEALAKIVNALPDAPVREVVANHFAQELCKQKPSFNAGAWASRTGGKLTGPVRISTLTTGLSPEPSP